MLILTRKVNQEIRLGNGITITIVAVRGRQVRVGIQAPDSLRILREELEPFLEVEPLELAGEQGK
jgi:carbon storage regulator